MGIRGKRLLQFSKSNTFWSKLPTRNTGYVRIKITDGPLLIDDYTKDQAIYEQRKSGNRFIESVRNVHPYHRLKREQLKK